MTRKSLKVRDGGGPDLLALSGKKQLLLGTVATHVERARSYKQLAANL